MSDDFLHGMAMLPYLLCGGCIADAIIHSNKIAEVNQAIADAKGCAITDAALDGDFRGALHSAMLTITADMVSFSGLAQVGAVLRRSVGMHEWGSECIKRAAASFGETRKDLPFAASIASAAWMCIFSLTAFIACPLPSQHAAVRAALNGSVPEFKSILDCETPILGLDNVGTPGPLGMAALAAERVGDDAMAHRFAERMLARDLAHPTFLAATAALLGRVAAREGARDAAVAQWQKAAAMAMEDRNHLLALRVGQQLDRFGAAAEGSAVMDAACVAMGRPRDEVVRELDSVGGTDLWPAAGAVPAPPRSTTLPAVAGAMAGGAGDGNGGAAASLGPAEAKKSPMPPAATAPLRPASPRTARIAKQQ